MIQVLFTLLLSLAYANLNVSYLDNTTLTRISEKLSLEMIKQTSAERKDQIELDISSGTVNIKAMYRGFVYAQGQGELFNDINGSETPHSLTVPPEMIVMGFLKHWGVEENQDIKISLFNKINNLCNSKTKTKYQKYRRLDKLLRGMANDGEIKHDYRILFRERVQFSQIPGLRVANGELIYQIDHQNGPVKMADPRKSPLTSTYLGDYQAEAELLGKASLKHASDSIPFKPFAILYTERRNPFWFHHLKEVKVSIDTKPILLIHARKLVNSKKDVEKLTKFVSDDTLDKSSPDFKINLIKKILENDKHSTKKLTDEQLAPLKYKLKLLEGIKAAKEDNDQKLADALEEQLQTLENSEEEQITQKMEKDEKKEYKKAKKKQEKRIKSQGKRDKKRPSQIKEKEEDANRKFKSYMKKLLKLNCDHKCAKRAGKILKKMADEKLIAQDYVVSDIVID